MVELTEKIELVVKDDLNDSDRAKEIVDRIYSRGC